MIKYPKLLRASPHPCLASPAPSRALPLAWLCYSLHGFRSHKRFASPRLDHIPFHTLGICACGMLR